MPTTVRNAFEPRKTPVQTRAAVPVEAIHEATVQVLLSRGGDRLTTRRRAGVSVGTLYQYADAPIRAVSQWILKEGDESRSSNRFVLYARQLRRVHQTLRVTRANGSWYH